MPHCSVRSGRGAARPGRVRTSSSPPICATIPFRRRSRTEGRARRRRPLGDGMAVVGQGGRPADYVGHVGVDHRHRPLDRARPSDRGTVKAAPDDQLRLLDLQALDSTLDRLTHRRRTLAELAPVEEAEARQTRLADDIVLIETEDSDLGREQSKLEGDIDQVRTRMQRDQQRLDAGQVGSPRELENLQHEIGSLRKRQSDLEDEELEIMEKRELVQARLAELRAEQERIAATLTEAEQRRDGAFAEITAETEKATAQRAEMTTGLPDELVTLYEKVRTSSSGIGAAALHQGRCEGCHLQLNTTDVNRIREAPADEVLRCEECRRILVRTAGG